MGPLTVSSCATKLMMLFPRSSYEFTPVAETATLLLLALTMES
jgi:hypothetical protein